MLYQKLPIGLLKGYTPKQFNNKQEFLNYTANFVLQGLDGVDSYGTNDLIQTVSSLEDVLEEQLTYTIFNENLNDMPNVHYFCSQNLGDGNEMETVYVLLDQETKEYTLVGFEGYYSSWDGYEFNGVTQLSFEPVTAYLTKEVL